MSRVTTPPVKWPASTASLRSSAASSAERLVGVVVHVVVVLRLAEDDGLARALVLVEDRRSISCADGTCTHGIISSIMFENVLLFHVFGTLVTGRSGEPIAPGITLCLRLSLLLSEPPVSALPLWQPGSSPRAGTEPAARRSRHRPRRSCLLRPRR